MSDLRIPYLGPRRLELGCGYRARAAQGARVYVGVDVHQPYLERAHRRYSGQLFMLADFASAMEMFEPNSFTGVYGIDFIEHLTRTEGKEFLAEAKRLAPAVAIFAPLGPMPQSPKRGMVEGDPPSQQHRSAWTPDDFPGWQVKVLRDFHRQLADGTPLEKPISAFWAIRR